MSELRTAFYWQDLYTTSHVDVDMECPYQVRPGAIKQHKPSDVDGLFPEIRSTADAVLAKPLLRQSIYKLLVSPRDFIR